VAKWAAFGWRVLEVDGHDMPAVVDVLARAREGDGRPTVVISHTVKGRGVSFMEGHYYWHTRALTADEFATAMADLGEPLAATNGGAR
jgi:transketolase